MNSRGFNKSENDFIDLITDVGFSSGLSKIQAKMFAVLYLQKEEISLEELSKLTGYSISSVSVKIRDMEHLGLVRRIKKPGTAKVFFFIPKDFHDKLVLQLFEKQEKNIREIFKRLPKIISSNPNESRKIMEHYLKEAKKMQYFLDKVKSIL